MSKEHQTSISPRNSATSTAESYSSTTDISEWESRIAKLVGLEEEGTLANPQTPATQEITTDKQATDPNSLRTKQSLSANPFAKAGLVGATTLVAVVLAGGFLSQIMSGTGKQPAKKNITTQPPQPETPDRLQQLETEVETLKTKLALAKQAEEVKQAQQQLRNIKPKPEVADKPSAPKAPAPVKNISPPEVITRVIREPQPIPAPQTEPPPPAPEPKPDPMQEWQRIAKLGSYGMVKQDISKQNSPKTASVSPKKIEPAVNRFKQRPKAPLVTQKKRRNTKSTVIGSSAEAVIATAVFGETTKSRRRNNKSDRNSQKNENVFVVRLEEPLRARDGEVVVPAGSEILTRLSSISDNGLMQLDVTKVLLNEGDELVERSVTSNALAIRGSDGKPLMAKNYRNNSSSLAQRDAVIFGLGGLGRAAQLFNRTQTRIVREDGQVFSETNNDEPDIAAGILEGGMRSLVPQLTRRNQQAISRMSRKSDLWYLKAGKEVEVYVNKEVQF